jgi:hypothetical protein
VILQKISISMFSLMSKPNVFAPFIINNRFTDNERPAFWQRGVRLGNQLAFPDECVECLCSALNLRVEPLGISTFRSISRRGADRGAPYKSSPS